MSRLPFNVLYLDINTPDLIEYYGSYDYYGGGAIFARAAIRKLDNFYIAAREQCFTGMPKEYRGKCIVLQEEDIVRIRNGEELSNFIPFLNSFQIVVHHFSNIHVNTKLPSCHWNVGYSDPVHPNNHHVLLFDSDNQAPQFYSNNHTLHKVVIGPKMPPFQEYKKEDLIVNIGRITSTYQSIQIAQLAQKYSIPMIFAGPLDGNGYGDEFLKYVGGPVEYLGVVDEATKIDLFKRSKLSCQMMNYPISITLSMKQGASFGMGCLATPVGQYRSFIKERKNGFFIKSEENFITAWNDRNEIKQIDCYNSVLPYSENNMLQSFLKVFNDITI